MIREATDAMITNDEELLKWANVGTYTFGPEVVKRLLAEKKTAIKERDEANRRIDVAGNILAGAYSCEHCDSQEANQNALLALAGEIDGIAKVALAADALRDKEQR